jgi:hypothetical protein
LFHVLLHCGLRAGEALLLPVGCVRSQHDPSLVRDRHWMTVRNMFDDGVEPDPRPVSPSLKNTYAVRRIPVTDAVAALIREFASTHRRPSDDTDLILEDVRVRPGSREHPTPTVVVRVPYVKQRRSGIKKYSGFFAQTVRNLHLASHVSALR